MDWFPQVEKHSTCCASFMPAVNTLLMSGNMSRHFSRQRATTAFVSGGLSILTGQEPLGLLNVGGGVERRITPHTALRLELRDEFAAGGSVLLAFRVGVVFR